MPVEEMILNILLVVGLFTGILGMTSMVLSHRRRMAEIKYGNAENPKLAIENTELKETVSLMQDRIAVLEQIATDPARRTADEIERLR